MLKPRSAVLVIGSVLVASAAWTLRDSARAPVPQKASEPSPASRQNQTISVVQTAMTESAEIPVFAKAIEELGEMPTTEDRQAARTNTLSAWAETDPRAAFLYLTRHGSGQADTYLSHVYFRQWAARDFTAAFDHAERQPTGAPREELFGALALLVVRANPAEAAAMTEQDMRPGPVRTETAISILHQWALADLERAASWATTFPEGPERERALREIDGLVASFPIQTSAPLKP
ncbi:MAG: hypothetical protein ABW223_06445 [Rariglobus sp.]